ncbi:MAG TPA: heme peroxidase family protein [Ktedonobacteraceae bacterium]|nr:heme peroxidase family protein [Ktedonobacteraceae bacterium]
MATRIAQHSCVISPHLKDALSQAKAGKYGRMFPNLPAPECDEAIMLMLGRSGSYMDANAESPEQQTASDNPRIPAGFTFIGQFVAHDITADRSLLQHHARLNELRNFRTPRLDLESLYAAGPTGSPYIYDSDDADKFLLGINDVDALNDLPRNRQGRAILGDPRDDVHLIISQLHLAFLKFHNAVVDLLREQGVEAAKVFGEAQRLVRWHYQWIVAHEFLPLTVGEELMQDILSNGLKFYSYQDGPYIPVEFADAAYRYGHSQVRQYYCLNDGGVQGQVFPDYQGTCPVNHDRTVDWAYFFNVDAERPPQASKRIDTILAHALINLPESVVGTTEIPEEHSLAYRDLIRGEGLDLPSGEAIARAMGVAPLTVDEAGLRSLGWKSETPLWYYILREAEVRYNGEHMGEVGGRIVAEVLMGLIDDDPTSYLSAESAWRPTLPSAQPGDFTVADLLRFAHVA